MSYWARMTNVEKVHEWAKTSNEDLNDGLWRVWIVASDNHPNIAAPSQQRRGFGSYAGAHSWARRHFNSPCIVITGPFGDDEELSVSDRVEVPR